jgi:hypothetical protein
LSDGALGAPAHDGDREQQQDETDEANEKAFHRERTLTRASAARTKSSLSRNPLMRAITVLNDMSYLRSEAILLSIRCYTAETEKCPASLRIRNAFEGYSKARGFRELKGKKKVGAVVRSAHHASSS